MPTMRYLCFACAEQRPAVVFARLPDGRMLSLCFDCAQVRDNRQAFVAAFQAQRKAWRRVRACLTQTLNAGEEPRQPTQRRTCIRREILVASAWDSSDTP